MGGLDLVRWPLIQAPMGGGPSRPELAAAVSDAGGMGFLAAGYKSAAEMVDEISATQRLTDQPFGVNVFVPYAPPVDAEALQEYLAQIEHAASSLGVQVGPSEWSDDHWEAKLAGLVQHPVAVVSFAFGCPSRDVVAELHGVGTQVMVTITNPGDADVAVERGVDALCVQGIEAGAHRGGFTDDERDDGYGLLALIGAVRQTTNVPLVAAGGVMDGRDLAAVLVAGAEAAQLGTGFCGPRRVEPTTRTKRPWPIPRSRRRRSPERSVAGVHAAWSTSSCSTIHRRRSATRRSTEPPGRSEPRQPDAAIRTT